jgi:hypothetical protein
MSGIDSESNGSVGVSEGAYEWEAFDAQEGLDAEAPEFESELNPHDNEEAYDAAHLGVDPDETEPSAEEVLLGIEEELESDQLSLALDSFARVRKLIGRELKPLGEPQKRIDYSMVARRQRRADKKWLNEGREAYREYLMETLVKDWGVSTEDLGDSTMEELEKKSGLL